MKVDVRQLCIDFAGYERTIKYNILPLWNIEKFKLGAVSLWFRA